MSNPLVGWLCVCVNPNPDEQLLLANRHFGGCVNSRAGFITDLVTQTLLLLFDCGHLFWGLIHDGQVGYPLLLATLFCRPPSAYPAVMNMAPEYGGSSRGLCVG